MENIKYISWLKNLKNLENKQDFLKENSFEISQPLMLIIDFVDQDGLKYKIDQYGNYMRVKFPNGKTRVFYRRNYGVNDYMIIKVYNDKVLTGQILEENNISTPKTFYLQHSNSIYFKQNINDNFGAKKFCEKAGFPIIAKPKGASLGRGVEKLFSMSELNEFLERFSSQDKLMTYLLQPYVGGKDIRVVFFDGKIQLAYERIAMSVSGDGKHNLNQLIKKYILENQNSKIVIDEQNIFRYVQNEGKQLDYIPKIGEKISLVPTSNVSSGGDVKNYVWNEKEEQFIKKVVDIFGAPLTGLDILTDSTLDQGSVLELNHSPMFDGANKIYDNFDKRMAGLVWEFIKRQEGLH